ncbi:hypothetical protein OSB04_008405, partial [Centaurea solstitialis]
MATISSSIISPTSYLHHHSTPKSFKFQQTNFINPTLSLSQTPLRFTLSNPRHRTRLLSVAEDTPATEAAVTIDPTSEAARRLYVGNIPRTTSNDKLQKLRPTNFSRSFVFWETVGFWISLRSSSTNLGRPQMAWSHRNSHKVVAVPEFECWEDKISTINLNATTQVMYDKYSGRSRRFGFVTMKTVDDANAAIEKLDGTEIGGRKIKVNVTEKPLNGVVSVLQTEETPFVDSPYKIYVGNLAKTVTSDSLKTFFAEKGNVVGAKVSRVPGTSKSTGFGFVSFSSEEEVEAAISSFNNAVLEGQKIR